MKNTQLHRRNFIKQTALAGMAMFLPTQDFASNFISNVPDTNNDLKVFLFSKHLQFLDYKNMSEVAREMGFDGLDLTVRPKGHVLPERVTEDLPKATQAMQAYGLLPQMISTNVIQANDPVDLKVLETASQLGYKHYRTDWIRYSDSTPLLDTVNTARTQFAALEELNKKLNISACYQNHSGHFFGSAIWDLHQTLDGLSPKYIGSQYDIMHASVEGGKNWEIGFRLIKPYINTIVVKDFKWGKENGVWKPVFTPLGEGMIDFKNYFSLLKKNRINVPLSIHVEYDLGGAEKGRIPSMDHQEVIKKIKKDLTFVRNTWKEAGE